MRKLRAIVGALALLAAPALPAAAQSFLGSYEDLPLPPSFAELPGSGMSFDSPGGRIVEAFAKGSGKAPEVYGFYRSTLPQLGWSREADTVYRRDSEVLRLDAHPEGRALVIRFHISPE